MANDLLLDTHILLWLVQSHPRLRAATRALIERHWKAGGTVHISAITGWEIGQSAVRGRGTLDMAVYFLCSQSPYLYSTTIPINPRDSAAHMIGAMIWLTSAGKLMALARVAHQLHWHFAAA